ncbi:hypothetical protein T4B_6328 [Trichinella pseudospiralis]|uniref:DUF5641 domain-containing protein n=1 Tax=Trichinella pseudospiralis TaxID=6337 RepID=A0A0V1H1C5_TRIPS|nr:hypothetical protein T4B_6328 [Trichinella pseudospiralis]
MRSSRPSCARSRLPQRKLLTGWTYADFPQVADEEPNWRTPERGPRNWQSRWRYRQQLIAKWWRRWRSEYHAPEVDQQSRGAGTERPRPDTGGQRPLSAMPPQGRGGTFSGQ